MNMITDPNWMNTCMLIIPS